MFINGEQWDGYPTQPQQSGYHWLQGMNQRTNPHPIFWNAQSQMWKGESADHTQIAWVHPWEWAGSTNYYGPAYAPGYSFDIPKARPPASGGGLPTDLDALLETPSPDQQSSQEQG